MPDATSRHPSIGRTVVRWGIGLGLVVAGLGHLTFARTTFRAQVPGWVPVDDDLVVLVSGVVEIGLGLALVAGSRRLRPPVGVATAAFFVAVFPGNVAQWRDGVDAFGLDTDAGRFARLFFQPVLVAGALWATGGWSWLRQRWTRRPPR